jgi:L-threonylcarbamoyladenylate synthase
MTARVLRDDRAGREAAVRVLRGGGVVALPTDTVYGLAADLGAAGALDRLFAAKDRPAERAIVLLLAATSQASDLAQWPPAAAALASAFWPGGLTLVLSQRAETALPAELTGGRPTIGLRVPDHAAPRALAEALGPLPVTSANRSGRPEAADAAEILAELGSSIDLILDGGPAAGGPASTVVECTNDGSRILRAGAISRDAIAAVLREAGLPEPPA